MLADADKDGRWPLVFVVLTVNSGVDVSAAVVTRLTVQGRGLGSFHDNRVSATTTHQDCRCHELEGGSRQYNDSCHTTPPQRTVLLAAGKRPGPPSFHVSMNEAQANDDVEADGPTGTSARAQSLIVGHRNELTPAEIQEINKRLRLRTFLLCVYASIWGMGGHLVGEASRVMCSGFVRQVGELPLLNL